MKRSPLPSDGETPSETTDSQTVHKTTKRSILVGFVFKIVRIICGVPILSLLAVGTLITFLSVTWQGRSVGLGTVLIAVALFCAIGYWNDEWFRRIRFRFYLILLPAVALLWFLPAALGPDGGSPRGPIRNAFLGGTAEYARFAPWSIVPEQDQVSVVIALSRLADKHVDAEKAARIRSLTMPIYREMAELDGFNSIGSAMGSAYCELLQMDFDNGHYFVYLPVEENEHVEDNLVENEPLMPCLVFLHGMGGNRKSNVWAMTRIASEMQCILIAPTFGLGNWEKEGGAKHVVAVTREAIKMLPIDPDNIFLIGYSNGAKGVTRSVIEAPSLYRGLIYLSPVTEDQFFTSPEFLLHHKEREILFLHGDSDSRIPQKSVEDTVELLNRLGGDVRIKIYPDEDHYLILSQLESICDEIISFMNGN